MLNCVTTHKARIRYSNNRGSFLRKWSVAGWVLDSLQQYYETSNFEVIQALDFNPGEADPNKPSKFTPQFTQKLRMARTLPFLKRIVIQNTDCENSDVSPLADLSLNDLRFRKCVIDSKTVLLLKTMSSLHHLEFVDCQFQPNAVAALSNLQQVYWLRVGESVPLKELQALRKKMPTHYVTR